MFDIRAPIGLLFFLVGALVGAYGFTDAGASSSRTAGVNLNLLWGGVIMLFGLLMGLAAARSRRKRRGLI